MVFGIGAGALIKGWIGDKAQEAGKEVLRKAQGGAIEAAKFFSGYNDFQKAWKKFNTTTKKESFDTTIDSTKSTVKLVKTVGIPLKDRAKGAIELAWSGTQKALFTTAYFVGASSQAIAKVGIAEQAQDWTLRKSAENLTSVATYMAQTGAHLAYTVGSGAVSVTSEAVTYAYNHPKLIAITAIAGTSIYLASQGIKDIQKATGSYVELDDDKINIKEHPFNEKITLVVKGTTKILGAATVLVGGVYTTIRLGNESVDPTDSAAKV